MLVIRGVVWLCLRFWWLLFCCFWVKMMIYKLFRVLLMRWRLWSWIVMVFGVWFFCCWVVMRQINCLLRRVVLCFVERGKAWMVLFCMLICLYSMILLLFGVWVVVLIGLVLFVRILLFCMYFWGFIILKLRMFWFMLWVILLF